ncbi:MAG: hypothetical protein FWF58_04360, partial [Firmicutes bacterium]|nr:hypothetical protein [Bacillota bacterium]
NNSIYQQNQDKLINLGYRFVLPQSGVLACGDVGIGKLAPVDVIVQSVLDCLNLTTKLDNSSGFNQDLDILKNDSLNIDKTLSNKEKKNFNLISHEQEELYNNDFSPSYESMQCDDIVKKDLKNKTVLITAGATIQNIDPVRYISNHSSGKMGLALAERVYKRGGNVILVAGNISLPIPKHYYHIKAETSREMHDAVMAQILNVDYFIMAAAPADYEAINYSDQKIKSPEIVLSFKKTIDIAKAVGQSKMSHQKLVIFSAESQNLLENARIKLMLKNADLVVANDITQKGAGFNVDTNIVTIISRENEIELPCLPKIDVADRILDILVSYT